MKRGAWRPVVQGVTENRTRLSTHACTSTTKYLRARNRTDIQSRQVKKTWLFHGESLPRGILPSFQITTSLFFYLISRVSFQHTASLATLSNFKVTQLLPCFFHSPYLSLGLEVITLCLQQGWERLRPTPGVISAHSEDWPVVGTGVVCRQTSSTSKVQRDSPGLHSAISVKSQGLKSSPSLQQVCSPCRLLVSHFLGLLQALPLTAPDLTAKLGSYSSSWPLEYAVGQPCREYRTFTRSLLGLGYMDSTFPLRSLGHHVSFELPRKRLAWKTG